MNLGKYTEFLIEQKTKRNLLKGREEELQSSLKSLRGKFVDLEEAQNIFNIVGILAQTEVKEVVESLVTEALQYVFGESYVFVMENQIVRNQPETYIYVEINGVRNSLKDELGGGVVDLVSFALRLVFWAIQIRRTRPIFILDEPFKNLDIDRLMLLGEITHQLSERFGFQLIIVTREDSLLAIADLSYGVKLIEEELCRVEKLQ